MASPHFAVALSTTYKRNRNKHSVYLCLRSGSKHVAWFYFGAVVYSILIKNAFRLERPRNSLMNALTLQVALKEMCIVKRDLDHNWHLQVHPSV